MGGVRTVQRAQGLPIAIVEEIAYENGWITREQLMESAERYGKSPYGQHLKASPTARSCSCRIRRTDATDSQRIPTIHLHCPYNSLRNQSPARLLDVGRAGLCYE